MTLPRFTRTQLTQARIYRTVRRPGLFTDIDGTGADLFTITGGPVQIIAIVGHVTTLIGAGACVPDLSFTPTGGGALTALAAAAASIANDAVNSMYTWSGLLAGQITVGPGIGHLACDADIGFINPITLCAGVISLVNAVSALSGVIDWYACYLPMADGTLIVAA